MTQITPTANAEMKAMVYMQANGIPAHFVEDDGTVVVNVPSSTRPDIDYTATTDPRRTLDVDKTGNSHVPAVTMVDVCLTGTEGTLWTVRRIEDYSSITLTLQ